MTDSDRKYIRQVAAHLFGAVTFLVLEIELGGEGWGRFFAIVGTSILFGGLLYFTLPNHRKHH